MLGLTDYFEISSFIVDFYMYWFHPFTRYGQHVKTLANYDGKDLLRLSKDDLILLVSFSWWLKNQMDWKLSQVGPVDGVRLDNDLHRTPVRPPAPVRPPTPVRPPRPRLIFDAWLCRNSLISRTEISWSHIGWSSTLPNVGRLSSTLYYFLMLLLLSLFQAWQSSCRFCFNKI